MKRLLLLFIFSPVILFGQMRRKAIVDSIKAAATNLQDVSKLVSKYPDAKLEQTNVSDSGEYVTIVVRVHVAETGILPALPLLPVVKIKTGAVAALRVNEVAPPPLPRPIIEAYEIFPLTPLAVSRFKTGAIPVAKMKIADIPPLPPVRPELINALAIRPSTQVSIADVTVITMKMATIPPLPAIKPQLIDALPVRSVTLVSIKNLAAVNFDTVPAPPPPNIVWVDMEPIPPAAAIKFTINVSTAFKTDTVGVPVFEQKKMPVGEMHLSDEGYSLLEKMEGFSPELYTLKDGGFTIGFGFFVPYNEVRAWNKGVTQEKAELLIREKMQTYEDQVKQYVNVPLTQEEFDALTMMAYNLGGFSKATSIVNDINSNADFEQLQKDWMRFVHSKAPGVMKGLMNRRKDELQVRNESNYQSERKLQIFKNGK